MQNENKVCTNCRSWTRQLMAKLNKLSHQEELQCNRNHNWRRYSEMYQNTRCPKVQERTEDNNDSPAANRRLQRAHKKQLLFSNEKLL